MARESGVKQVADNRKARHDYSLDEKFEVKKAGYRTFWGTLEDAVRVAERTYEVRLAPLQ